MYVMYHLYAKVFKSIFIVFFLVMIRDSFLAYVDCHSLFLSLEWNGMEWNGMEWKPLV